MLKGVCITLFIIMSVCFLAASNLNYGLYFKSYADLGKDRTSLVLNNGDALKMKDETTLSFDMYIRKELEFGCIIHIINDSGDKIAMNFSADNKNNRYPSLIINERFYPITNKIAFEQWIPVSLKFSSSKDSLHLSYGDIRKSYPLHLKNLDNIKVAFGACRYPGFETFEVPAINIKDIKIHNKEKLVRHWALKEHSDSLCYDLINRVPAKALNPVWLIDSHSNWKKVYSKEFKNNNNPQYAFDVLKNIFYIVPDEKTILTYNPLTDKENVIHVKSGYPASFSTNGLIYDRLNEELLSYNLDEKTISRFSFQNNEWSKTTPCEQETRFWHHTASINTADSTLVAFGGYGFYRYKNDLFIVKPNDGIWERNQLLTITPRYSPASVVVDNRLYIFGGRGSETGKQEVNPQFKYDLYSVDLNNGETKLLWETQEDSSFLPCGNMIYNAADSCFYVLTNIENGTLIRITTRNSRIEKVSNGIKQPLTADFLFYNLYLSENQQKLYALFCLNWKQGMSFISLYEINFPPLSQSETLQNQNAQNENNCLLIVIGILSAALLVMVFMFITVRKKKKNETGKNRIAAKEEQKMPVGKIKEMPVEPEKMSEPVKIYDRTRQCISLLGGFNVMNKDGNNITSNFTPILKNLLLLILLYSQTNEKGVKDNKIDNLLWGDKDSKAARNNRNVSLTRLKLLLENIGSISLFNNNGFWRINFGKDVFCDYNAAFQYIKHYKTGDIDKNELDKLLELLMFGQLLPYTQSDWVDKFKSDYSNDAIDILYNLLQSVDRTNDERLALQIADTIFLFDSLNEEALGIKCSILYNSGKKGLAKNAYDIFVKEYKSLLGEKDYKYSLVQVLEEAKNT
jgi:DNA-binding SARP family transcriptional activator